jgi:hypothetical protein
MILLITKPFVCDSVQLRTIHTLAFLADVNNSQSWPDLPIEDVATHA